MICGLILVVLCCVHSAAAQFPAWPTATSTIYVPSTIFINSTNSPFDCGNVRYVANFTNGSGNQNETQPRIFQLADGAIMRNCIIGAPAADGLRCKGSCKIENFWWEDVGEDACTFYGGVNATYSVTGGGAKNAEDKVFQFDGGGVLTIKNFQVEIFGKLLRTCGNCPNNSPNLPRKTIIDTIKATGPGRWIAAVNFNYGDSVTLKNIYISGGVKKICAYYKGTNDNKNDNPQVIGNFGPTEDGDGKYCVYKKEDIHITDSTSTTRIPSTSTIPSTTRIPSTSTIPSTTRIPSTSKIPSTSTTRIPSTSTIPSTTRIPITSEIPSTTRIPSTSTIPRTSS